MSGNKKFIVFFLLFFFAVGISAQVKNAPHEVRIDKFLDEKNFAEFQFLVSTRENIKAVFGKDCEAARCDFDDDWKMKFNYVNPVLEIRWFQPDQPRNRVFTTFSKPEYREKLLNIEFYPRRENFLRDDFVFPDNVKCFENGGREFNCWGARVFVKYNYKKGAGGAITQKQLVFIRIGVTQTEYETIRSETQFKDVEETELKNKRP